MANPVSTVIAAPSAKKPFPWTRTLAPIAVCVILALLPRPAGRALELQTRFRHRTPRPGPPRGTTIAPPAAHVKRAWPGSDAKLLRQPGSRGRDAEHGRRLNAGERQTRANAPSQGGATERPVRLLRRSRRRARRLRRGRRTVEAQPLEQGPQRRAPRVHRETRSLGFTVDPHPMPLCRRTES